MNYNFFDSHAHLSAPPLFEEAETLLLRAHQAGVKHIVNICTDVDSVRNGLQLAEKWPGMYNAAAVHPHDAKVESDPFFAFVQDNVKHFVAIGETGLDYHYQHSKREDQISYLIKHLQLARQCGLPVIIHCREAFFDIFSILNEQYQNGRGVFHCFTGTLDEAKRVLNMGFYLSLSGVVTFKKSSELREVAKFVPLDRLLIETDAPFLAPQSQRGKSNEPSFLVETAAIIAAVKGITISEVAQCTSLNAKTFFCINKKEGEGIC